MLVNLQSSSSTMAFRGTLVGHQWGAQVHLQQLACGPKQIRCNTSAKGNFLMKVSTSIKILGSTTSSPGLTPSHGHGFSSLWNKILIGYIKLCVDVRLIFTPAWVANTSQIFNGLVHPLKVVKIKNPFGILQTNTQIPQDWVGLFDFQKNMFCWDTLGYAPKKKIKFQKTPTGGSPFYETFS